MYPREPLFLPKSTMRVQSFLFSIKIITESHCYEQILYPPPYHGEYPSSQFLLFFFLFLFLLQTSWQISCLFKHLRWFSVTNSGTECPNRLLVGRTFVWCAVLGNIYLLCRTFQALGAKTSSWEAKGNSFCFVCVWGKCMYCKPTSWTSSTSLQTLNLTVVWFIWSVPLAQLVLNLFVNLLGISSHTLS